MLLTSHEQALGSSCVASHDSGPRPLLQLSPADLVLSSLFYQRPGLLHAAGCYIGQPEMP